jgi:hypothetical protein
MRRFQASFLVLLAVLMLALAGYWLGEPAEAERPSRQLQTETDCQPIDRWCHAGKGRYGLALRIDGPVIPLTAFPVELEIEGLDAASIESVKLSFEMQGMDMGLNRFELEPVSDPAHKAHFRGMAMLPVCVTGRADWRVIASVATATGVYEAGFDFSTSQDPK